MPYRHAHWWVLALVPVIAFAFWPNYFSQVRTAPFAHHAHGLTATAWILLVLAQSWSIATRRMALHRSLGLATFVIVPLFAAGGALALQAMVALFVGKVTPFHALFGVRLAAADAVAAPVFVVLVALALHWRRRVRAHAAAMLSTILLVLPPVFGRVFPALPGFPADGAFGLHPFELSFHLGESSSVALAAWLAAGTRDRQARSAFNIVVVASLAQMLLFETVARTAAWRAAAEALLLVPAAVVGVSAAAIAAGVLWLGWRPRPPAVTPVAVAA